MDPLSIGTFCSQVRIANSRASCLPSLDDRSFKCLWRCSWGAIAGHHDGSEWFKWHTLTLSYLIWHPICSWLLSTCAQAVYSLGVPIDDGSFKCIQRCSGWADCFEWFKSYTLRLSCLNMTSHFQLTIANSRASCLPPKDDGSIKCLQRCSWRAVPGAMTALNGSNDRPWHCLIMTSHFQLTIGNSRASCLVSTPKRGGILQMSSKMQLTSCSRALETKYHGIIFAYI